MSNSYRKSVERNQIEMAFIFCVVGFFRYQLSCSKYHSSGTALYGTNVNKTRRKIQTSRKKSLRELETNSFYSVHNESHA